MAKSFVLVGKNNRHGVLVELKAIDALDKPSRDKALRDGWFFMRDIYPLLVEQDSSGGEGVVPGDVDLSEIYNRLDGFDIAIDQVGSTFDQVQKEISDHNEMPHGGGGGADFSTRHIEVEIYGGLAGGAPQIQNVGAIRYEGKYTHARLSGNILKARFTISNGGLLNEGPYYIKPLDNKIKGYHYPMGIAQWHGNRHDQTMDCHAEWQQYNTGWFIRMPLYNYDYYGAKLNIDFEKDYPALGVSSAKVQVAGTSYLGKRCPVVAQNDSVIVTIPVFPL